MSATRSAVRILLQTWLWILLTSVAAGLPQAQSDDVSEPDGTFVTYYIYPTSDSMDSPTIDDTSVLLDGQPLTMVFHGFRGSPTARSMQAIKEALLLSGVTNVVVVDWSVLADDSNDSALKAYHVVRDHGVPAAGAHAAQWIIDVMDSKGIGPGDVHLVGFSLGAHVTGIIGQNLNSTLGRISGLDPPHFGYEDIGKDLRLDKGDAVFVNAIHTSGGILSYTETNPIGHVDFFPNGDNVPQEGCPYENPIDVITCSHYMAFALFAESVIHQNALVATQCDSWKSFTKGSCANNTQAPMGFPTPPTTRGKFFMKTNKHPPYGHEDAGNPLPDSIKSLLVYNTSEAFIQPQDVVNFLAHPGGASQPLSDAPKDSKVMKVTGGSKTTTTPDPPSFASSGGSDLWSDGFSYVLTALAGYGLWDLFWNWWQS